MTDQPAIVGTGISVPVCDTSVHRKKRRRGGLQCWSKPRPCNSNLSSRTTATCLVNKKGNRTSHATSALHSHAERWGEKGEDTKQEAGRAGDEEKK